jgi:thiosulfate/3-mercaptopyruvate sulfurtransferase
MEMEKAMMRSLKLICLLGGLVAAAGTQAAPALVDADWAKTNLDTAGIRFIDVQDPASYKRFHIPGAVNAPYAAWRTDGKQALAGMLPPIAELEAMLGGIGISADDHLVIVATGQDAGDLAAAARVFWTLKVLGHARASVLDGGLVAYAKAGGPIKSGNERVAATTYRARPDTAMAPDAAAVQVSLDRKVQLVDARTEGEFAGIYTGDKAERPGTIPGSKHLPYDWVVEPGTASLRDPDVLRRLFAARGISDGAEQIHFCHSGNRAALTWFAAYAVFGNEEARLYDGSMMEWARRTDLPVEAAIDLCVEC